MDRRLRPGSAVDARHAGAGARTGEQPPLAIHQLSGRHDRPGAAAAEAGDRHRHHPRLPGRPGRVAPRRDCPRRPEAVEHHAQADRQRQDRGHRLGLRAGEHAVAAHLHARLRRAGSVGTGRMHPAVRPGQSGLRAGGNACRRAAVRRKDQLRRPVGGQAVLGPTPTAPVAGRGRLQRAFDEFLPGPDRP